MPSRNPNIAYMGGGTGLFTQLQGITEYTPNVSAIVTMSDSGGSSGELRDEQGILPPGDLRQCLVALSTLPDARDMFSYRFTRGKQVGDSLGNLIIAAYADQSGDFREGIKKASRLLQIEGSVLPVTYDDHHLVLHDGVETIIGERFIDDYHIRNPASATVSLSPEALIDSEAQEAIERADIIVIAPGSVYTSLLPIFAVKGMKEAFESARGRVVAVTNLVTKAGQTDDWHVADHIRIFEDYLGEGAIDTVLFNNEEITPVLLEDYAAEGDFAVNYSDEGFEGMTAQTIGARLVSKDIIARSEGKRPTKTLIRHDANEVGRQLMRLFYS